MIDRNKVHPIVADLMNIEVDGDTMEYILGEVSMREQMLRQLIMSSSNEDILELLKEKLHIQYPFLISE